jgi:hypothetical protein
LDGPTASRGSGVLVFRKNRRGAAPASGAAAV